MFLRLDHQLRGEQTLRLVLRYMRTIDDVSDKLRAEGQIQVVAVDITCLLSIDNKEVVSRLLNRNIGIFSNLDVALRSENEEPASVRGETASWRMLPCSGPRVSAPPGSVVRRLAQPADLRKDRRFNS